MAARHEIVVQLEEAASIVLSPPNLVSTERRTEAEAVFHQMRKLAAPYSLCQSILGTNCSAYVQFQSVVTMKEALLREWVTLPIEERHALKCYLLDYISKQSSLAQYIQRQIFVLLAILVKRGVLEPDGLTILNSYICDISQLISNSFKIELGCSLLSVLLVEFSSSFGLSAIGKPLEFHVKCKRTLEENGGLLSIFTLAVQTLDRYVRGSAQFDIKCISSLLSLSLEILSWDFRSTYFYRSQHLIISMNHTPFRPPSSFRTVILNSAILNMYIELFKQCSDSIDLVHVTSLCLSQLASLSGPVLASTEDCLMYLITFLQSFIPALVHSEHFSDDTVYGVATILRQLATTFSHNLFSALSEDVLQALVNTLTNFHEICAQRIIVLESCNEDVSVVEESLCFILEVVVRLLEGPVDNLTSFLKGSLFKIFSVYLQSKLNVPHGLKQYQTGSSLDIDMDKDDRENYADELSYIGTVSRYIPNQSLPLILDVFVQCYSRCLQLCQSLLTGCPESSAVCELEAIYEDLHWLMLITTFTLTDVVESEDSIIPDLLLKHSVNYQTDITSLSVKDLVLNTDVTNNGSLVSIDPIVSLIVCLCQWSVIEKQLIEKGLKELVSPQVCETATWSMCTVFCSYIIPSTKYEQMSPMLAQFVVDDTDDSKWLLSFVLDKISYNCTVWYTEEKLTLCTVMAFSKLARSNKTRASHLCNCDTLWLLMRSFTSGQHPLAAMSLSLQKGTISALLSCAGGEKRQQFINELLEPLSYRFQVLIGSLSKESLDNNRQLLLLLESWDGVVTATHNSFINIVFPVLCPILSTCVQLLQVFHTSQDVSQTILNLFCHVAENFTIFLNDSDVNKLYEASLQLISVYSKYHIGKYASGSLTDDDHCEDLVVFIQTLSHLTTKDYIDFGSEEESNSAVSPIEVVLTGLSVIIPVINEDILKYPNLCKTFYQLLHYICEIFPDSFCALNEDQIHYTFKLIDLGCTRFGSDITLLCVECIEAVSKCSPNRKADILTQYVKYFVRELFLRLLNHSSFENDLLSSFSGTIYQLICVLKERNIDLDDALSTGCNDTDHTMKDVLKAIEPLLTGSRTHKRQFKTYFMDVLPNLRNNYCMR